MERRSFLTNPTASEIILGFGVAFGAAAMLGMAYLTAYQFFGPNGFVTNATPENMLLIHNAVQMNRFKKVDAVSSPKYADSKPSLTTAASHVYPVFKKPTTKIPLTSNDDVHRLINDMQHFYLNHYPHYILAQDIKMIRNRLGKY